MKSFTVGPNDAGQRLDRFLNKACPGLPSSLLQKALRRKNVKRNGRPAQPHERVCPGDEVAVFLPDEVLKPAKDKPAHSPGNRAPFSLADGPLDIVYEDEAILLVGKPAGLSVHEDETGSPDTLINRALRYLHGKGDWDPARENGFAPALCHRLDRNTAGLVLIAKTAPALRALCEKMRTREIRRRYLCVVHGIPRPASGTLRHYLWKDERRHQAYIRPDRTGGAKTAVTRYRVLDTRGALSLVRCELETGRTHQIRAQFAAIGHPLLGDGKYGRWQETRLEPPADTQTGRRGQALCSYHLSFTFPPDTETIGYLHGKTFTWPASLAELSEEAGRADAFWRLFET